MVVVLVFGIDVSGDIESGNHKYMAVFICTEEFFNAVIRRLQLRTAKNEFNKKAIRKLILDTFEFDAHECFALCIKIERKKLLQVVERKDKTSPNNLRTRKILYAYNKAVWRLVSGRVGDFLKQHKQDFGDAVFESDGDCISFLKDVAIKRAEPSYAHMIADAIAWANNAGKAPKGVIEMDATEQIAKALQK